MPIAHDLSAERIYKMLPLARLMPGMAAPRTYAAYPVWKHSTAREVKFEPLSKKQAAQIWHKARRFDRQTHQPGRHGGAVGRTALNVLYALLFDFLNYRSGRLDPCYDSIARAANVSRRAVADALKRLKALGILHWIRRCSESLTATRQLRLKQETNAYMVMPASEWRGFIELAPEPPHPSEWGAVPPLPSSIDQALIEWKGGADMTAGLRCLEEDPNDRLALLLARLGRSISAKH
jgi:hypothetical protein